VEVTDDATGEATYFPCGTWLDKKEGDGLIERVLPAAATDATAEKCPYKITVHTSDIRFAGTDANVFIEVLGTRGGKPASSGRVPLNSSKNDFERGAVDVFNLTLPNVGEVQRIVIGHDDAGAGGSWHLNMARVVLRFSHSHRHTFRSPAHRPPPSLLLFSPAAPP